MFNKLFSKILDSSIWLEPTSTRIVWITLLAAMDQDGYAHFSALENLASRARVLLPEAETAVACFLAPDPNSGNPDFEGRRIEKVPGGFLILNAKVHREMISSEVQRELTRLRVARFRAKKRGCNAEIINDDAPVDGASVTGLLPSITGNSGNDKQRQKQKHKQRQSLKLREGLRTLGENGDSNSLLNAREALRIQESLSPEQIKAKTKARAGNYDRLLPIQESDETVAVAGMREILGFDCFEGTKTNPSGDGGKWRVRWREKKGKVLRVFAEILAVASLGPIQNRGVLAEELWKEFQ